MLRAVTCAIIFILFDDPDGQGGVLKLMKKYDFLVFLAIQVIFSQVFGQVKKWPILKFHEMIRVLHVVALPIIFILFGDQDWQGGVLKFMKNDHDHFSVLLAIWVLSLKILDKVRVELCMNCTR